MIIKDYTKYSAIYLLSYFGGIFSFHKFYRTGQMAVERNSWFDFSYSQ